MESRPIPECAVGVFPESSLIKSNDWVLIEGKRGLAEFQFPVQILPGRRATISRTNVDLTSFVGLPTDSVVFLEDDGSISLSETDWNVVEDVEGVDRFRLKVFLYFRWLSHQRSGDADLLDNRDIVDSGGLAQARTYEEIEAAKLEKGGEEIISDLAQNSSTFAQRTQYSKDKWLKRKRSVHLRQVRVRLCDALALCEPGVIVGGHNTCIRWDAMSILLSWGAVRAGGRAIVVDGLAGHLTAAVVERMSPARGRDPIGHVIAYDAIGWERAVLPLLRVCGYSSSSSLQIAPLADLVRGIEGFIKDDLERAEGEADSITKKDDFEGEAETTKKEEVYLEGEADTETTKKEDEGYLEGEADTEIAKNPTSKTDTSKTDDVEKVEVPQRAGSKRRRREEVAEMLEVGADRALLAFADVTDRHVTRALLSTLRVLRPGSPVALFARDSHVVAEAIRTAVRLGMATQGGLSEPFTRQVQVLPGRTHPTMTMDGTPGFVGRLVAIPSKYSAVIPSPEVIREERSQAIRRKTEK